MPTDAEPQQTTGRVPDNSIGKTTRLILRPAQDGMFLRPPPNDQERRIMQAAFRAFIIRLMEGENAH